MMSESELWITECICKMLSGVGGRESAEAVEEASEERGVAGRIPPAQAEWAVELSHSDRRGSRVFGRQRRVRRVEQRAQECGQTRGRRREHEAVAREPVAELCLVVVHQRVVHDDHQKLAGFKHLMSTHVQYGKLCWNGNSEPECSYEYNQWLLIVLRDKYFDFER